MSPLVGLVALSSLELKKATMSRKPRMKPGMKRIRPGMNRTWAASKVLWVTNNCKSTISLEEHYLIGSEISSHGIFGTRYQCKRKLDGKICTVTCIAKSKLYRIHHSQRIRRALLNSMGGEMDIMLRLKHQNFLNSNDQYEDKHSIYYITDDCTTSDTLFDKLAQIGKYTESDAKPIIKSIVSVLYYLHDQHRFIHGNLTPHHILFHDQRIKVTDFGMSKICWRLRSQRRLCDVEYYIPPEATLHNYWSPIGHSNDMWSVGVILFLMLSGYQPFFANSNEWFGQKQNEQIRQSVNEGYTKQKWNTITVIHRKTDQLVSGFIQIQQTEFAILYGHHTFYIIAPAIAQMIMAFYNDPISAEAHSFMEDLMDNDESKRLSAKECMYHPWLVDAPEWEPNNAIVKSEQTEFIALSLFRQIVSDLFEHQFKQLTAEQFMFLKGMFAQYDDADDGRIAFKQFEEVLLESNILNLDELQIKNAFKNLDQTKVTKINYKCLIDELIHDYMVNTDQRLYEAFRALDEDEDGKIKMEQLMDVMKQLNIYGKHQQILNCISIEFAAIVYDGSVDYEEFLRLLHPSFTEVPTWFTI
eukprot:467798_1